MAKIAFSKLPGTRLIVVVLQIKGQKHDFLVDTGAENTILAPSMVDSTKPKVYGTMQGIGGNAHAHMVFQTFCAFGVTIPSVIASQVPVGTSGLIGQDILSQFSRVIFDYQHLEITFEK